MPLEVLSKTNQKAARDWPDAYTMQKDEIDAQVRAYLSLSAELPAR